MLHAAPVKSLLQVCKCKPQSPLLTVRRTITSGRLLLSSCRIERWTRPPLGPCSPHAACHCNVGCFSTLRSKGGVEVTTPPSEMRRRIVAPSAVARRSSPSFTKATEAPRAILCGTGSSPSGNQEAASVLPSSVYGQFRAPDITCSPHSTVRLAARPTT